MEHSPCKSVRLKDCWDGERKDIILHNQNLSEKTTYNKSQKYKTTKNLLQADEPSGSEPESDTDWASSGNDREKVASRESILLSFSSFNLSF